MAEAVGPVVYQVYVNGMSILDRPLNASLKQAWGSHDIFSIRIEYNRGYPMNTIMPWPDEAPVSVVWGRRPDKLQTWYGYVNHYELASNADSGTHNLQITYYLIGTSLPMNTASSRIWGNVSPTYIAKRIALKYRLRCVLTQTNWVLDNETQASMSDFAYMNYLADKTGYRFWVSGGTLYFIDPAVIMAGTSQQAVPIYRQDKLLTQQDTIRDFRVLRGVNLPGAVVAERQVFGIDRTSGHLFGSSTGSGSITKVNTSRAVSSWNEATQINLAWARLNQFWICAYAELFGNNLIYPGKVVYLDGTALPGGNTGYWIVNQSRHILLNSWSGLATNDKYVTQVTLLRNTDGIIPDIKDTSIVSPEFIPCAVSDGIWYSTSMQVTYNGAING